VTVPKLTGVTTPDELTVATDVLLLVQMPPVGDPTREIVDPRQAAVGPLIDTAGFTVTVWDAAQPDPTE
jgi:hypothetical protein